MAWLAANAAWEAFLLAGTPFCEMGQPFRDTYRANLPVVVLHGVTAVVAMMAGLPQFLPVVRTRWPRVHRALGMSYAGSIVLAALSAFQMGTRAYGPRWFLCVMSVLWAWTTWRAVAAARRRRFAEHAAWMVRSYALTFGAVTVRVYLSIFAAHGYPMPEIYSLAVYAGWLPNLALAELGLWWSRRRVLMKREVA